MQCIGCIRQAVRDGMPEHAEGLPGMVSDVRR